MEQWFRNRRNPVILYGFGGIGKTELAIEYGRQAEKRNHAHTYLVTFRESMYATVTGPIAQAFGCPVTKERPEEQVYELVMEKLQEHLTEDDLLIIDKNDTYNRSPLKIHMLFGIAENPAEIAAVFTESSFGSLVINI